MKQERALQTKASQANQNLTISTANSKAMQLILDDKLKMDLLEYQYDLTVDKALKGTSLVALKKQDKRELMKAVHITLQMLLATFRIKNKPETDFEIMQIVMMITDKYYYLRLDELLYCFRRVSEGAYGKVYGAIDNQTICGWIDKYDVEERTPHVTHRVISDHGKRKKEKDLSEASPEHMHKLYKKMQQQPQLPKPKKEDDAEYKAFKARYIVDKINQLKK
ncbi:hypothetical protein MY04_4780 [Flammeovirga sp. MY04]|uniref:hypothetical protein n=1 Tax=Flammeovirga sp. MY04 TaxID=1191459 RepID=UPI00130511CE|nr:hypothetical protein [Flammeovirga sp. MY04]ANQ49597.2 hypothetical protein MY04_2223 [Flammeovirga sp. MY04]ANQ52115.2 hypothetical protein MY04_4780 [Flammeovirga sp. MY04]